MPTALALSPHLDDAVFSAGGTLARLARAGWRVVVATVFTASVADPKGFALACQLDKGLSTEIDYMALRRDEDACACGLIGAEPIWLPFVEAPHRGYHSAAALFEGLRGDDRIVDAIKPAIDDCLAALKPDLVLGPQAIGAHVDHVAVYLALRASTHATWLWADYPYSIRAQPRPSPFFEDMTSRSRRSIRLSAREARDKLAAIDKYASQIAFQFGERGATDWGAEAFAIDESFADDVHLAEDDAAQVYDTA